MKRMLILALVVAAGSQVQAEQAASSSPVYFRATFDGSPSAQLAGAPLAPSSQERLSYIESDHSQALLLGTGAALEYELDQRFPGDAGSIEVRFKPAFPQDARQAARTIFSLVGPNSGSMRFAFQPQGTRWQFAMELADWKTSVSASYFRAEHLARWTHLVLTWDDRAEPGPVLQFYRDGRWDRHRTKPYLASFQGFRRLVLGAAGQLDTALDEVVIYDRALGESEVAFLHENMHRADRFAALVEHQRELEQQAAAERSKREAQIAQLTGRVAYIINPRGGQQRDFPLPGGIVATGLRVEDVGKVDLAQFAVIYGPPGAGYQLTDEQGDVLRQYIRDGGGYVGVCAGANYAGRAQLLNMSTHSFKNQGLLTIGIAPHAVTAGLPSEMVIHHGNGPIMVPGEGCQVLGTFQIGQGFPITTAAIVAGENGQGRVVAFGPHPTGGGVEFQTRQIKFSGDELGTDTILVNALLWAARIVD